MAEKHEDLEQEAKDAIDKVFGDQSVSKQQTYDSLLELRDHIGPYLDTLRGELDAEEEEAEDDEDA